MQDIQLIADNCETYNGAEANFTKQARHMVEVVRQALDAMDNMGQLEKNIALVQERARNEADIEWEDDERDSKYFQGSRDTSPEFGEGDTSNLERPSSSLSMASGRPGPSGKMSEKRSRGRPRKMQHEEGRGQYSTDDEEFEEVTMSDNEGVSVTLDQSNAQSSMMLNPNAPEGEGDSQQAAEAMVQLSGTTQYFTQPAAEESMEIDPNYDPSDFLGMSNRQLDTVVETQTVADDSSIQFQQYQQQQDGSFQQFGEQQQQQQYGEPQQVVIEQPPQDQQQQQSSSGLPPLQSLHKDLAISDSDDEQNNLQMDIFNNGNENDDNDDGGDLWF